MMGIPTIKDKLKFLIHPTGSNFRPNLVIKVIRIVAILIQRALFVSGKTRWGNEFIQVQNPLCETEMNAGIDDVPTSLILRTGHGRLFWRATDTANLEVETNIWINSFSSSDVFYDVGANIGLYSLFAAKRKQCKVIAFEPDQFNSRYLHENMFLNGVNECVQLVPLALGERSESETLFLSGLSPGGALNHLGDKSPLLDADREVHKTTVPVITLNDAMKLFCLPQPTKLKIDVDGHEWAIIKDALIGLTKLNAICIELTDDNEEEVIAELEKHNFVIKAYGDFYHGKSRNLIFGK